MALHFADGWYYDDVPRLSHTADEIVGHEPRYEGWRRVLSLQNGSITFHVPDEFDVGNLKQIPRNWDGHSTPVKWRSILERRGIKVLQPKERKEIPFEEQIDAIFQKAITRVTTKFPQYKFDFNLDVSYEPVEEKNDP